MIGKARAFPPALKMGTAYRAPAYYLKEVGRGSNVAGWDRSPIHTSDSAGVRGDLVCVGTWCEQHRLTVLPLATKALTSREKANGIRAQKRRCSWWCKANSQKAG